MEDVQWLMGYFCEQLGRWSEMEQLVRDGGAGEALDQLIAAWDATPQTDPARVAELLGQIETALVRAGLPGTTMRGSYRPLPAGLSSGSDISAWVCPRRRCARVALMQDEPSAPQCALGRTLMTSYSVPQ